MFVFFSFQKLNIPCLNTQISNIFCLILQHYASEVGFVKQVSNLLDFGHEQKLIFFNF